MGNCTRCGGKGEIRVYGSSAWQDCGRCGGTGYEQREPEEPFQRGTDDESRGCLRTVRQLGCAVVLLLVVGVFALTWLALNTGFDPFDLAPPDS